MRGEGMKSVTPDFVPIDLVPAIEAAAQEEHRSPRESLARS
jgi:hypothetical protein